MTAGNNRSTNSPAVTSGVINPSSSPHSRSWHSIVPAPRHNAPMGPALTHIRASSPSGVLLSTMHLHSRTPSRIRPFTRRTASHSPNAISRSFDSIRKLPPTRSTVQQYGVGTYLRSRSGWNRCLNVSLPQSDLHRTPLAPRQSPPACLRIQNSSTVAALLPRSRPRALPLPLPAPAEAAPHYVRNRL